jgi:hypothetical protein
MKKNTRGNKIVRLTIMRFETNFLVLQSLISQAQNMKRMLTNDECNASKRVANIIGKTKKRFLRTYFGKKQ